MDGFGWWITKELGKSVGKVAWEVVKLPITIPMHVYENSIQTYEKKDEDNDKETN